MQDGTSVDVDEYSKDDPRDFVLWKSPREGEPSWDYGTGPGRPGWHIECSAMSLRLLGEAPIDIHAGGIDLVFPHHENEIAQSEGATKKPFARVWVHVEHLFVEGEKMSKSLGNVYTLSEIAARGHRPSALRYLLLSSHYRKQLNFTWEGLSHATAALERIHGFVRRLGEVERQGPVAPAIVAAVERAKAQFEAALCDDLNTSEALSAVHGLVGEGNALLAAGEVTSQGAAELRRGIEALDSVFAVLLPSDEERLSPEEQALFDERQAARLRTEFRRADQVRAQLEARGVVLEDTPKGTRWRRR
jgi:cysteinyl-tRNA synthetase